MIHGDLLFVDGHCSERSNILAINIWTDEGWPFFFFGEREGGGGVNMQTYLPFVFEASAFLRIS